MTDEDRAVPRKPRLLVLASTYPRWRDDHEPGFVHELARRLAAGFEVTVLCPHAPGARREECLDGVQVRRYRYAPAPLQTLVSGGGMLANLRRSAWKWLLVPGFFLAQAFATWRALRQVRPDVVHVHWLIPQGLVMTLLAGLPGPHPPFVVTSHGADLFALRGSLALRLRRWVAARAARLTVVSPAMRDRLVAEGIDATRIEVISMGVDLQARFSPDPGVARLDDEILFVGRLVEKKGLRHLLEAMPAILEARPQARLTIVGFGPEEASLRAQAESLGLGRQVHFAGAIAQAGLPAFYRRAAVFVAPFVEASSGDQEGLGLVAIEAAGCGCRVVISRIPATRALLDSAPSLTGVPPKDPVALAQAVIASLASAPGDARSEVLGFDWENRAAQYQDLLAGLLGGPPAGAAQAAAGLRQTNTLSSAAPSASISAPDRNSLNR